MQREVQARDEGQQEGADKGDEDAELGCCSEKQGLRVGDERSEISHGTDTHEDQDREDTGLRVDTRVEQHLDESCVTRRRVDAGNVGERDVGQEASEPDGDQKQRLKPFLDCEIQQQEANEDHHQVAEAETLDLPGKTYDARRLPQLSQTFSNFTNHCGSPYAMVMSTEPAWSCCCSWTEILATVPSHGA